jgi:hypothetical protein
MRYVDGELPPGLAIQRRAPHPREPAQEAPASVKRVLGTCGNPLDEETRHDMEQRFGRNFRAVRVHEGSAAAQSARDVYAHAYTVGNHIVFGDGRFSPRTTQGRLLLAHELTHVLQQGTSPGRPQLQRRAEPDYQGDYSSRENASPDAGARANAPQKIKGGPPKKSKASAPKKSHACVQFPGGDTDCVLDSNGVPTGKILVNIEETNPCTRPCVELHENVHVKQLTTFCPELRDCWNEADKGARDLADCWKMGMYGGGPKRECPAYKVSVACLEKRLASAKECQSEANKAYGTRKLEASEKCFRDKACGAGS